MAFFFNSLKKLKYYKSQEAQYHHTDLYTVQNWWEGQGWQISDLRKRQIQSLKSSKNANFYISEIAQSTLVQYMESPKIAVFFSMENVEQITKILAKSSFINTRNKVVSLWNFIK